MSYKDLEIWKIASDVSVAVHKMTVSALPKFELYEQGSQIRRSSKSIRANIVEGYGRRAYKAEFIRFLTFAFASCIETTDHLECLHATGSFTDTELFKSIHAKLDLLGRKLNLFIQAVNEGHRSEK
jgi:four helix bundle protein